MTSTVTPPRRGGPGAPGDQYVLDLQYENALSQADFVAAPANEAALGWIERWPDWPAAAVAIHGPAGAGKSHLAQIWLDRARAVELTPEALSQDGPTELSGDRRAVLIDGADRAAEEPLLHLFNMVREQGGSLLLVAREPPSRWGIGLADLRSRLVALPAVGVAAPDAALIGAVLAKLFSDRRRPVSRELISYLTLRLPRSFAAAQQAVVALDHAATAEFRPLTVPLAGQVLKLQAEEEEAPTSPPTAHPSA
ncbi:MAG TPA: DNA replication protein [Stellaceae bacterium]